MSSLTINERYIQHKACEKFPAQELWIKDDNQFWAYKVDGNDIYTTSGCYENKKLRYRTVALKLYGNVDSFVSKLCHDKTEFGYHCFAIQM